MWETVRTIIYAVAIAVVVRTFLYEPFNIPSGSMKPTLLVGDYLFVSKFAYGYSRHSLPFSPPLGSGRLFGDLPERGDVAVFKLPSNNRTDYIKRIVGLPGDRIQVREGTLFVNDQEVVRAPIEDFVDDGPAGRMPCRSFLEGGDGATHPVKRFEETMPALDGADAPVVYTVLDECPDGDGEYDNTKVFEVPESHVFAMGDNRDNSLDSRAKVGFVPLENLVGRAEIIFFSTNGSARIWEIWKWPITIRYGRLFNLID
ncbi:MAG: signal peptidase I [Geminicoccaceae bacterium]